MKARTKKVLSVIKYINSLPSKKQKKLISSCDKQTINCICECVKNILRGGVKLTVKQLSKLKRRKKELRALVLKNTSLKKKRKILQTGGFLPQILIPAIGLLSSLFSGQ